MPSEGWAIGIDIGTTNTRVAVFRHGPVEIIPDIDGGRMMPSYVSFTERVRLIGSPAKNMAGSNMKNTVFGTKRVLGRQFDDEWVRKVTGQWPFEVVELDGKPMVNVIYNGKEKTLRPLEIYAMILKKAKENAEAYLQAPVTGAVLSIPCFRIHQHHEVVDAARLAGLSVFNILSTPEAIATAYEFYRPNPCPMERNAVFLDLGAGFFNVGISVDHGDMDGGQVCQMLTEESDTELGGEEFVNRMVGHFSREIKTLWGFDVTVDARALRRLHGACEVAKRNLSSASRVPINIDSLYKGRDFQSSITQERFQEICQDLFRSTLSLLDRALQNAELEKSEIDEVIVMGGSSRVPQIQKLWTDYFGGKPLIKSINIEEGEVQGLAIFAARYHQSHYGEDPMTRLNILALPLVHFSMGVKTVDGMMKKLVHRNHAYPTLGKEFFSPDQLLDRSSGASIIYIYEGENNNTKYNKLVGILDISEIGPLNFGERHLYVKFDVSSNRSIEVCVSNRLTQKSVAVQIPIGRLQEKDLLLLMTESERYEVDEQVEAARILNRSALDSRIASLRDALLSSPQSLRVEELLNSVEAMSIWAEENDAVDSSEYRSRLNDLEKVSAEMNSETEKIVEHKALESRIVRIRESLLSFTETPKLVAFLDHLDLISAWLEKSDYSNVTDYYQKKELNQSLADSLIDFIKASKHEMKIGHKNLPFHHEPGKLKAHQVVSSSRIQDDASPESDPSLKDRTEDPCSIMGDMTSIRDGQKVDGASPYVEGITPLVAGLMTGNFDGRLYNISEIASRYNQPRTFSELNKLWSSRFEFMEKDRRVRIAVLDTGFDYAHRDFQKPRAVSLTKDSTTTFPGEPAQIDRIKAFKTFCGSPPGEHEVQDIDGHGTQVAGIILRVAPRADLLIARICEGYREPDLRESQQQNLSENDRFTRPQPKVVADAIDWAIAEGADLINMSFGFDFVGGEIRLVEDALKRAQAANGVKKAVVFAAMSNEGNYKPAAWPARDDRDAIGIHSCADEGAKSKFTPLPVPKNSNFIVVGEGIIVHRLQTKGGGFCMADGTSFATPIAVAMAALIMGFVNQKRCREEKEASDKLVRLEALWENWGMIRVLQRVSEKSVERKYSWIHPKLLWKDFSEREGETARSYGWSVLREALKK